MNGLGGLHLRAQWDGQTVSAVNVENRRPMAASVLAGRSVDEAVSLVPVMFSLCGRAQGLAARAACAAARGGDLSKLDAQEAERAVAVETAQEHLWRLLIDWPALFDMPERRSRFASFHKRLRGIAERPESAFDVGGELLDLVVLDLFGGFFRSAREPVTLSEFVECARASGDVGEVLAALLDMGASVPESADMALVRPRPAADWAACLGGLPSPAYCRAPTLEGVPCENGVLARQADSRMVSSLIAHRHRIAARLFARVVDLVDCASRLRRPLADEVLPLVDAVAMQDGIGLASVESARGTLLHVVSVDGDTVVDYAIVAPTEWNFCPGGPFEREASGWTAPDREIALRRLRALTLSLDPCVEYSLELVDAVDDGGGDA